MVYDSLRFQNKRFNAGGVDMLSLITKYSTFAGIFKLIFLIIIFAIILVLSYIVTKWYANSGLIKNKTNNISVVENFQLSPGRTISIIKIGEKYVAIAQYKDSIVKLAELSSLILMKKMKFRILHLKMYFLT